MTEALECVERARGHLYSFHQLMGHADLKLDEVMDRLRDAGETEEADRIERELVGRNVLPGRWTFQVVEQFDDQYWEVFREHEQRVRTKLVGGRRHVFEAEMKERRRTDGLDGHEASPQGPGME
ncbi:MAG TPA: hypothetical protein VEX39_01565 [Thermoleophilaceae bacterium]|nr:hypothetical protein [Thermoleophilaceae bacterium]